MNDRMPERRRRRSIRLQGYDYAQAGAYFVTICAQNRESVFGEVLSGEMVLNGVGRTLWEVWSEIPQHYPGVEVDAFVVMPNHVHGIIVLVDDRVGARHAVPLRGAATPVPHPVESFGKPVAGSLPTIIRAFKSACTRRMNVLRRMPGTPVWQRNYYEHIIRDEKELELIRQYVAGSPGQWALDRENPRRTGEAGIYRWLYARLPGGKRKR